MGRTYVKQNSRGSGTPLPLAASDRQLWVERVMRWLVAVAAALVPLIVYLKSVDLRGVFLETWRGTTEHIDFFNWYKSMVLIALLILLTGLHIYRFTAIRNTMEMPRRFLPLLIFGMFTLLSTISSSVSQVALQGFTDRYESVWVLLCYLVLCYTAFVVTRTETDVRFLLTVTLCSSLVVFSIGLFQFLGMDFFQTSFGKRLILPAVYEPYMDQLTFNFGRNIMYTTVYNPNYLGSYASLLIPVSLGWLFSRATSSKKERNILWLVLGLLIVFGLFVLWFGSMSRAGLLGGVAALFLFVVLQARRLVLHPVLVAAVLAVMAGSFLLLNAVSGGLVVEEFRQTLPSRVQQRMGLVPVSEEVSAAAGQDTVIEGQEAVVAQPDSAVAGAVVLPTVKTVWLKDSRFHFATETETIELVAEIRDDKASLRFFDAFGGELRLVETESELPQTTTMVFEDSRYANYRFSQNAEYQILSWFTHDFVFLEHSGQLAYMPKPHTYITEAGVAPFIGFEGHERFATNRGWIWSRTLPLLGKALFTGYGPDTFSVFFPKDDIAWRINLYGAPNIVVDKPHNWFLQTAVNTGVISLLMLLWLLGGFMMDSLRARFNRPVKGMGSLFGVPVSPMTEEPEQAVSAQPKRVNPEPVKNQVHALPVAREWLLAGILCGVVGYAIAGVFNDSVVSVAPIFWVVLGTGMSLLRNAERAPEKVEKPNKSDQADKTGAIG